MLQKVLSSNIRAAPVADSPVNVLLAMSINVDWTKYMELAVTVLDAMNIYDEPSHLTIDFRDFYYSFGLGISFVIPNFPIRLYLVRRFKYDRAAEQLMFANSQAFFQDWDLVLSIAGFF